MRRHVLLGFDVVRQPADLPALDEATIRFFALPPGLHPPALLCSVLVVLHAVGAVVACGCRAAVVAALAWARPVLLCSLHGFPVVHPQPCFSCAGPKEPCSAWAWG